MALKLSNISFGYSPSVNIFNGLNVDVNFGETLAIVGPSGCGKSTLLRLISGILPNSNSDKFSGQILIEGYEPKQYIKENKLAFMFQEPALMPNLTVKENIELPLKIQGIKNDLKINDLIEIIGLGSYANFLPKQLSGGMKTRVALARSFITQPELLLLDEPFSALDIAWKKKLYIELEKLRQINNTTIVIVTHDIQEALLLGHKIMVLGIDGNFKATYNLSNSAFSISGRLDNMPVYFNNVSSEYFYPIQDLIMNENIN